MNKKSTLLSLACLCAASMMAASEDVTSQYLTNYQFDGPDYTWNKDASSQINEQAGTVAGWTFSKLPEWYAVGTAEYGSGIKTKGQGVIPSAGYEGSTGGCITFATAWGGEIYATQQVTLPKGTYTLYAPTYSENASGGTAGTSLLAWLPEGGDAVSSNMTYENKTWKLDKITFRIAKETTGQIRIGYTNAAGGSGATAKPCIDYLQIMREDTDNLMYGAITNHKGMDTPAAPWYAYNTSTNEFGNGDGWEFRAESGAKDDTGTAKQLFLRWNAKDSKWIYAYKVSLQAEHSYTFTCDATTNDNKTNTLVLCSTTDMAEAQSLSGEKYKLDGINNDKLWTSPLKVSYTFSTPYAGDYYIIFKSSNLSENIIIRIANVSLVDNGEIDPASVALDALKASIQAGKTLANSIITNPELIKALTDAISAGENMTENNTVEEINAAKESIDNASKEATNFAETFKPIKEMYDKVLGSADENSTGYAALKADADKIYEVTLNNKNLNDATVLASRKALVAAQYAYNAYGYVIDVTDKIINPSFEDDLNGWDGYGFSKQSNNDGTIVAYKDGNNYIEKWVNNSQGVGNCMIHQTVNLEPGDYVLIASAQSQRQGQTWDAGGANLYAGEAKTQVLFMNVYSVKFTVEESDETPVTRADETPAGVDTNLGYDVTGGTGNWVSVDNFKLYKKQKSIPSAVEELDADLNATPEYYDLQGRKITNPENGLYIVKQGNKVTKRIIR